VNVKAQALLNATAFIEETHGQPALRDIIRSCSPAVRDRYTSAIAIDWHPLAELVEFLDVAELKLGTGDGKLCEQIGAAGARINLRGVTTRLVFYVARPEFLIKRIAQLWTRFNDAGAMELLDVDDHSSLIEVTGVPAPHWLFCCTLTGWAREVVSATGGAHARSRHIECRARGATRCLWRQTWTGESLPTMAERDVEAATRRSNLPSSMPPSKKGPPGD
jgi:hypothetical protein